MGCFTICSSQDILQNNKDELRKETNKVMEKVNNYLKLNDKYLKEGNALLEKDDYAQASEKFLGATLVANPSLPVILREQSES